MRPLLACLLALCAFLPSRGQEVQTIGIPMLVITTPGTGGKGEPMRLHELRVSVKVVGHVATTTWDMTVANPQTRVLEGELVFPLGEGQTISRFAMDVNGKLQEGVPVERDKGRTAFEQIVRRNVDPGLLEKTAGNSFRTRVYPIPAQGFKRVVVAYDQELGEVKGGLLYRLPLAFTDKVGTFALRVEVLGQAQKPVVASSPMATFEFKEWKRAFVAEETLQDVVPGTPLAVTIPRDPEAPSVFVEKRGNLTYLYATLTPKAPREPKVLPRKLAVAWDASNSANQRDLRKEMDLLEAYLRRIGDCEVHLAVFRDRPEAPRTFRIKGGDATALRRALEALPMDGATSLGALDLRTLAVDETLLFSDGMNTLGGGDPRFPAGTLVSLNSSTTAEHGLLRALAESRGGEYLNLTGLSLDEALKALQSRPLTFLGATFPKGDLKEVLPAAATVVRGTFGLAAQLTRDRTRVTLHFGHGRTETFTRVIDVDVDASGADAPVARVWAQKKLADLELHADRNHADILALGQEFGLASRDTSLIVLDTLEDYLRYRITPPEELREAYFRRLKESARVEDRAIADHLAEVARKYAERKAWWEKEFKPAKPQDLTMGYASAPGPAAGNVVPSMAPGALPPPPPPAPLMEEHAYRQAEAAKAVAGSARKSKEVTAESARAPLAASIEMKVWSPDTPYLKQLKATPAGERYATYLNLRKDYGTTPGFFLDVSDFFRDRGEKTLALRILSNLAEMRLEDPTLLRILGYRLRQLGFDATAVWVFEEVLRLRKDETQSTRDLALACAKSDPRRALRLLWQVVRRPGDGRAQDISLIAAGEMNALIATCGRKLDTSGIDPRLLGNLPVDIRVVLNWDTDNSDMDLHVVDPRGETCFYGNNRTQIGGRISTDVTQGYGPEEFLLHRAIPGKYRVKANFYGTRQQTVIGATTVNLELYLRYGTGEVENKSITVRLDGQGRMVDIGEFVFEAK